MALIETDEEKKFKLDLWNAYYPMDITHYSEDLLTSMTSAARKKWDAFLACRTELKELGVTVYVVPLNFDTKNDVWWVDYPGDYVSRFYNDNLEKKSLTATMRLDFSKKYNSYFYINIDHNLFDEELQRRVKAILDKLPFFKWDGTAGRRMRLNLEDEYELPGYDDPEPTEAELNGECPSCNELVESCTC